MSQDLVAIITGAGQGIGAGVARSFAVAGYKVSLMSLFERSMKLARELGGIGRRGSALDTADLEQLVQETRDAFGRIDTVVSNIGHGGGPAPSVTTSTVFDRVAFPDPLAFRDGDWHSALDMYVLNVVRIARLVT